VSETTAYEDLEPVPGRPGLRQTPATGRHAILPRVGLPEPDVIAPLAVPVQQDAELPDLDIPGRLPEDRPRLIRRSREYYDDPEKALAALIGECHFLMSEVAFRCIVQSSDGAERRSFMNSAMGFAKAGAEVANAVATLRTAPHSEAHTEKLIEAVGRLAPPKPAKP
jgi:hypothetical protein